MADWEVSSWNSKLYPSLATFGAHSVTSLASSQLYPLLNSAPWSHELTQSHSILEPSTLIFSSDSFTRLETFKSPERRGNNDQGTGRWPRKLLNQRTATRIAKSVDRSVLGSHIRLGWRSKWKPFLSKLEGRNQYIWHWY